jgi:hypothetical protein
MPVVARSALAFGLGFGFGAAVVLLRPTGPMWLLQALQRVVDLWWVAVVLIVLGTVLRRVRPDRLHRLAYLGAAWLGFPIGFFGIGFLTCAFCLQ